MLFQILTNEMINAQPKWFENRPTATEMHHDVLFDALQAWLNKKTTFGKASDQIWTA
jgi:hypothetical protein